MFKKIQELNVYVVVKSDSNKYLILRRAGTDLWEFPGGGIEWGEEPVYSGVREVEEEVGLKVDIKKLMAITSAVFKKTHNNERFEKHAIYVVYYAEIKNEEQINLSEEHEEFRWIEKNKLKELKLCLNAQPIVKLL